MKRLMLSAAAIGSLLLAIPAKSNILFEYSGVVRYIAVWDTADDLGFEIGQRVSGAFLLELPQIDINPDPANTFYQRAVSRISFDRFSNTDGPSDDYSYFSMSSDPALFGAAIGAFNGGFAVKPEFDLFEFSLEGGLAPVRLTPESLLGLQLSDYDLDSSRYEFTRSYFDGTGRRVGLTMINAKFDYLNVREVPIPTTVLLMLGALAALATMRRRYSLTASSRR